MAMSYISRAMYLCLVTPSSPTYVIALGRTDRVGLGMFASLLVLGPETVMFKASLGVDEALSDVGDDILAVSRLEVVIERRCF